MPNPKPKGRPQIEPGHNLEHVGLRLPAWVVSAIKREARARGTKPGTLMRETLTKAADEFIAYPTLDGRR